MLLKSMVLTKLIKKIYILEGPFDSTFIENSVAMCGADLDIGSFGWSDHIWVFDNEPRNREINSRISKVIDRGDKVVIQFLEKNMSNGTKVVKRDGSIQPLDLEKMHVMVEEACKGLAGVSASQVEIQSGIQFYDGITTAEIQEILIKSASDLISVDHPNYQYVAARLLLFSAYLFLHQY